MRTAEHATAAVERLVIGADYGADGYTTREQADELSRRLQLRPGVRLLELGTGRGWPGVYLTKTTGCQVVLTDVPVDGLRAAAGRASKEGIADRSAVLAASGALLPFGTGAFDAVTHADVLCCLRAKLAVLRECRRVLRRGGRMAFYTIHVTTGLDAHDRRRAIRRGPPSVASRTGYHRLLRSAGFTTVEEVDVTAAYLDTARRWLRHQREHADSLATLETPGVLHDRLARREAAIAAIEAGLLRRSLFVAQPGGR